MRNRPRRKSPKNTVKWMSSRKCTKEDIPIQSWIKRSFMNKLLTLIVSGIMLNMSAHANGGRASVGEDIDESASKNHKADKRQKMEEASDAAKEKSKAMGYEKKPNA